jgi:hypothetical protein
MTHSEAAQLRLVAAELGEPGAMSGRADIGAVLGAVATIMRQTVERFEETVGRISELVVTRSNRPDRELVVALQDFDRLQQEFAALGDVVAYFAATASTAGSAEAWAEHHGHQAITAITVADLRDRLLDHLRGASTDLGEPEEGSQDVVF